MNDGWLGIKLSVEPQPTECDDWIGPVGPDSRMQVLLKQRETHQSE